MFDKFFILIKYIWSLICSICNYIELLIFGHARQVLFNRDDFVKNVLSPIALKNKNSIVCVRVGPWIPFSLTRHIAVVIPKSIEDLDVFLKEIELQPDGRSILNPFVKMVGQTLSNNTGEFAIQERQKLLNFTGNVPLFSSIIQRKTKETLDRLYKDSKSFILLDTIKLFVREIAIEGIIGKNCKITSEENKDINLCFKALKQKLLHPYSISTLINFNTIQKKYKTTSENFQNGLFSPKTNVLADIIRDDEDLKTILDEKLKIELIKKKTAHSMLVIGALDGIYINLVGTLLQIIKYPDIVEKLSNELKQKCQIDELGYKTLSYEELTNYEHKQTYLEFVIKEGLRHTSSAPLLPRYTSIGVTNGNIKVPPYTTILINLEALHHDETFWGDDVKIFNPERWSRDNIKDITRFKNNKFLPFSTAPRPCPGINVGLFALRTFISELFLNYTLIAEPNQSEPIVDSTSALIMDIGPGYKVLLKK
jgi:hypothetical protein